MILNIETHKQIQDIFTNLSPEIAREFICLIESSKNHDEPDPALQVIEPFIRKILHEAEGDIRRKATALRAFCTPFETLLMNQSQQSIQPGRISRQSISPVWNWLKTELLPETIPDLTRKIETAAELHNKSDLKDLYNQLYLDSSSAMHMAIRAANDDNRLKKKYSYILGSRRLLHDLDEMKTTLEAAKSIQDMRRRLPIKINDLNDDQIPFLDDVYRALLNTFPNHPHLAASVIMAHLSNPPQIMRIAINALGTNELHIIARTPFGIATDMLLHDLEILGKQVVSGLENALPAERILSDLNRFYTLLDGFIMELKFAPKGEWGRRITRLRIRVAEALEREIEQTPHLLMEFANQLPENTQDRFSSWLHSGKYPANSQGNIKPGFREKANRCLQILEGCRNKLDHLPMNLTIQRIDMQNRNFTSCISQLAQPEIEQAS
jgi:hypothetical protein